MGYDLLISGGTIIDGTGRPGFTADIAITGDRIAAIEPKLSHKEAKKVIDARGQGGVSGLY